MSVCGCVRLQLLVGITIDTSLIGRPSQCKKNLGGRYPARPNSVTAGLPSRYDEQARVAHPVAAPTDRVNVISRKVIRPQFRSFAVVRAAGSEQAEFSRPSHGGVAVLHAELAVQATLVGLHRVQRDV